MRIQHEINAPSSVGVGGSISPKMAGDRKARGFHIDMMILVGETSLTDSEEIHIEGSARHTLDVLKRAIEDIEALGDDYVQRGALRTDWKKCSYKTTKRAK